MRVMKYLLILCAALLLTGCAAEGDNLPVEVTDNLVQTFIPEEMTIPETTAEAPEPELLSVLVCPKDTDFVRVTDYIPGISTELKYAATDNFTGQAIYEFEDIFLRYGTVVKLKAVSDDLAGQGLGIKIWDGFRPVSAQFKLWEICPDDTYVANPNVGYSNHSRGFAVDLTLVDEAGNELPMPTGFDDFSSMADRDYSDCDPVCAENARLLETVMEKHGFQGYWGEWWHFNDKQKYDVEDCFEPVLISRWYTVEEVKLLDVFWDVSTEILTIPAGEPVTLLGYREEYAMVEYWGYRGYLPTALLRENQ